MKTKRYRAAGGVVIHEGQVLLLDRPQRREIRLPKGHVEDGETIEEAAIRETTEETGYADLKVQSDLGEQVVEFDYDGKHIIRTESYYLMGLGSDLQIARDKNDAEQFVVLWRPIAQAVDLLTFEAEQKVTRRAIEQHIRQYG